jgi:Zn-dependent protease with chaperone function
MIVVAAEHFLVLSTALAALAFAVAWAARALARGRRAVHPHTLARLYAVALAGPPLLATWLVATAFLPAWSLSEPAFEAAHAWPLHDLHLLAGVLGKTEHAFAVTSVLLLVALAVALVVSGLRGGMAVRRALAVLRHPCPPGPLDEEKRSDLTTLAAQMRVALEVLPANYPVAFVWGTRRTTLVLSSGLIRLLARGQLRAVLAHEGAHRARRDNLGHLVLLACAYSSLAMPLSRRILTWYNDQVELVCDEIAARATGAPLDLAAALVSIRRFTLSHRSRPPAADVVISSLAPRDGISFEQRVRRLVAFSDEPLDHRSRLTRSFWPLARLGLLALALTMGAVALGAPLATHHAIEACLRLFG